MRFDSEGTEGVEILDRDVQGATTEVGRFGGQDKRNSALIRSDFGEWMLMV